MSKVWCIHPCKFNMSILLGRGGLLKLEPATTTSCQHPGGVPNSPVLCYLLPLWQVYLSLVRNSRGRRSLELCFPSIQFLGHLHVRDVERLPRTAPRSHSFFPELVAVTSGWMTVFGEPARRSCCLGGWSPLQNPDQWHINLPLWLDCL